MQHDDLVIKPLFYNQEILLTPPPIVYRHDAKGQRKYYSISEELQYIEEASVTTILDKVMPTPYWLELWKASYGLNKANQLMKEAGFYGTLDHTCLAEYLILKQFDLNSIEARINTFVMSKRINFDTWEWSSKLKHDLLAFHKFVHDYNVVPLAVEIVLISNKLGYGGAIDLVCQMRIGTGENGKILKTDIKYDKNGEIKEDKTRTVTAVVDFKSGRHGFSESNEAQVHMYKNLFTEFYPHVPIEKVYNWAPKDWNNSEEPAYYLKDQTNSNEKDCIEYYVKIFKTKQLQSQNKIIHNFKGVLAYGKDDFKDNLEVMTFEEKAISRYKKQAGKTISKPVNVNPPEIVLLADNIDEPEAVKNIKSKDIKLPEVNEDVVSKVLENISQEVKKEEIAVINTKDVTADYEKINPAEHGIEIEEISFDNIANLFKD
ncbi:MAG: hypothetical protein KF896_14245 [Ignavibacteriae bacterium]|nr:hypothetical protein [Ignavibacteriota bacterium]